MRLQAEAHNIRHNCKPDLMEAQSSSHAVSATIRHPYNSSDRRRLNENMSLITMIIKTALALDVAPMSNMRKPIYKL